MAFFSKDFLQFFIDLAPNNNKEWFDANRSRYEKSVKDPFKKFVEHMISELAKDDKSFKDLEAKDCIFRINRDIRFSKDKTPYKLNVSAIISPDGKKSEAKNGVYFELSPEHLRVYGGIYEIDKDNLLKVREGIASDPEGFKKAYSSPTFKKTYGEILGDKNKVLASELKESAAKEPLIFNKQWYFYAQFDPETILEDKLDQIIIDCHKAGKPVKDFFQDILNKN